MDEAPGRLEAAVQVDGSDHGLEQACTHRGGELHLAQALADAQAGGQAEPIGGLGQGGARDHVALAHGQLTLRQVGPGAEELLRHDEVEDGIPEELQALVVPRPGARMGQRLLEQGRVHERVGEVGDGLHGRVGGCAPGLEGPSPGSSRGRFGGRRSRWSAAPEEDSVAALRVWTNDS